MKIACFSFTDKGKRLGDRLESLSNDIYNINHYENKKNEGGIKELLNRIWTECNGLIFISATGIALRMINPYIQNKTIDPAVVVVDDMGSFSISLLSGHIGGGNDLAEYIGHEIGAMPVITTATDNRGIESIDNFAKKNDYCMEDMKSITRITSMMVNGKTIGLYTEDGKGINYDNIIIVDDLNNIDPRIDGLIIVSSEIHKNIKLPKTTLIPKNINIGMGCRKGVETERIIKAVEEVFYNEKLSTKGIKAIATVEVKKDEKGIIQASKYFHCPMKIFTIDEIKEVEDKFEKSQFVKDTIGVYSVSEPTAYLLGGEMIAMKSKHNGITISISKEKNNG